MIIKGLQKLTLIDFPGKIACTIFTFGCNFRCPFCYNVSLVIDDSTPTIPVTEILSFLEERKDWLDGVCISGGEPTLHADLPQFIARIKKIGLEVKLDTNGSNPQMLEKLLKARLLDYIAMDIKAPWRKYPAVVKSRVDLEDIRKSFKLIIKSQIPHEMRTTVVPKIHKEKDVIEIAKQIREARIYFLQQFRPIKTLDPKFLSYSPIPYEKLREWAKKCSRYIPTRVR